MYSKYVSFCLRRIKTQIPSPSENDTPGRKINIYTQRLCFVLLDQHRVLILGLMYCAYLRLASYELDTEPLPLKY